MKHNNHHDEWEQSQYDNSGNAMSMALIVISCICMAVSIVCFIICL